MRITLLPLLLLSLLATSSARADLRITRDHGGYVTEYKAKYERIRDRKELSCGGDAAGRRYEIDGSGQQPNADHR